MILEKSKRACSFIFQTSVTDLLRKQTVHNKEQNPLKTAKDGEQVRHYNSTLLKLETSEYPHGAQHTQLGHCSNGECPTGGNKIRMLNSWRIADSWQKRTYCSSLSATERERDWESCRLVPTHFIFCNLSRSGFKLENFCANFHTVMRKKKIFIWKKAKMMSVLGF